MVINAAYTFVFSLLTLYAAWRYVIDQGDDVKEMLFIHVIWQLFFTISTLTIIYTASLVNSEVNESKNE